MTKKSYFLSADFQANPTDISWQKVAFLVIQNYALLFLSYTAFNIVIYPGSGWNYIKTFLKLQDSQSNDFQSLFNQNAVIYRLANDKQIVVTLVTLAMIS